MGADEQPSPTRKRGREEELADGGAAEKRPREEGPEGASLLGLINYEDDDEEEAARDHSNGLRVEEEDEEDEDEEEDERRAPERRPRQVELRRDCPYLDTVNRQVLDFDFEKFCSISLSNLNVLEAGHHVFINLQTEKAYCLPDGYEINDPSLEDIRHVLNPRFTREQVLNLDKNKQWSRALDGSNYLPGMVSPHEFLQAVMKASNKRFQIGVQSDPVEFMSWLLNTLHAKLKSSKKKNRSIIHDCFQGELEVVKEVHRKHIMEMKEDGKEQNGEAGSEVGTADGVVTETSKVPFLMLGLDLPPPPLFKDAMEKNIIPQVPLFNILKKFDGETVTEVVRPSIARMRYRVTRLPKYLILHMRRFTKNNFFVEKNPTLVNFPVKNLELKDYIPLPKPKENDKLRSKYDLIANIVHDGKPGEGCYRVFVQRKSEEAWYEMQDLHVTETLPQMVALSEAYMQIYEQHE
ncbi:hypothetical protein PR202_gb28269 [Eleusine coracana subsp. coracana]|uniref:USP domain-containing protein n=1 Tax=Eleusine coracana subsp. coracana TaxID=191504 RepID=A0AAV5FWD6_ELECO|nr:hypothetical protein PR202_gb28269 [Eleusine coracana subsp. coracana]